MKMEEIAAGDPVGETPGIPTTEETPSSPVVAEVAQAAIGETEQSARNDKLEEKRLSPPPPSANKIHEATRPSFPFPALASLDAAVRLEGLTGARLRAKEADSQKLLKKMDCLLTISQKLIALPDSNAKLDEETCDLLKKADIWKEEFEKYKKGISTEQAAELKSLSTSFREKYHSENHLLITAMQNYASNIIAILEQANGINRQHRTLLEVISRNSGPR